MEANYASNHWKSLFLNPPSRMPEWMEVPLDQRLERALLQPSKHQTISHRRRREMLRNRRARSPAHQPPLQPTAAFHQPPAPAPVPSQSPWYCPPEIPTLAIPQISVRAPSPRYSPGSTTSFSCYPPAAPVAAETPVFRPKPLPAQYDPETPTPRPHPNKKLAMSFLIHPQNEEVLPPPQPHQQWAPSYHDEEISKPRPMAPALTYQKVEATVARWESDQLRAEEEQAWNWGMRDSRPIVHWQSPLQVSSGRRTPSTSTFPSPSPPVLTLASSEKLQRLQGSQALEIADEEKELTRLQLLVEMQQKKLARLNMENQHWNDGRAARMR
ncbi:hypothetical protein PG996_001601 [Apiospora saccharicola]|uniref:Uncharacterized protein n=1 Tax=Apiospora saccharicola TaxID=335842 RepID=A0ABR1WJZ8_9PEZI